MRVVLVRGYGDVSQLSYGDTPNLKPGPEQVLVRMAATCDSSRLEQLAYEVAAGRVSIPIRREFKLSAFKSGFS